MTCQAHSLFSGRAESQPHHLTTNPRPKANPEASGLQDAASFQTKRLTSFPISKQSPGLCISPAAKGQNVTPAAGVSEVCFRVPLPTKSHSLATGLLQALLNAVLKELSGTPYSHWVSRRLPEMLISLPSELFPLEPWSGSLWPRRRLPELWTAGLSSASHRPRQAVPHTPPHGKSTQPILAKNLMFI